LLIILIVTSSVLLLTSGSTLLQQNNSSLNKTETLFSLLEKSNSTVLEIIKQLENDGVSIPKESYDKYDQAQILAAESQILFQSGDYSKAEDKIIQSLDNFKEVLKLTYASLDNQTDQQLTSAEKYSQIQSSINRYYKILTQVQNLTNIATRNGFNTINLQEKIQTVTTLLIQATANLEQNRF
jgi:biotin operon repressor